MFPQWWSVKPNVIGWYMVLRKNGLLLNLREHACTCDYIASTAGIIGQKDIDLQGFAWYGPLPSAGIPLWANPGKDMQNNGGDAVFASYYIPVVPT